MNECHGLLIMSDRHLIVDVSAQNWSTPEIQRRLGTQDEISFRQVDGSGRLAVSEFLNGAASGKPSRSVGFQLRGETYYGNALLIADGNDEETAALDPHRIARIIHFLRVEHSCADGRYGNREMEL